MLKGALIGGGIVLVIVIVVAIVLIKFLSDPDTYR